MELNNFELDKLQTQLMAKNKMLLSRDTLGSIIKSASEIEHKQAFDKIIERIAVELDPRSVSILIQLEKILSEETSFFDEVDDDTE